MRKSELFLREFVILFSFLIGSWVQVHAADCVCACSDSINGPIPISLTEPPHDIIIDPPHRGPVEPPLATIEGHNLCIYADATKQVSVYPVDYDDQTAPLYSTVVPESTYSTLLPSWLSGAYVIEIVLNGHTFVGEIEL